MTDEELVELEATGVAWCNEGQFARLISALREERRSRKAREEGIAEWWLGILAEQKAARARIAELEENDRRIRDVNMEMIHVSNRDARRIAELERALRKILDTSVKATNGIYVPNHAIERARAALKEGEDND